jgi:diguanylate cyclase (GGDEF)-like protein/PAS domain S-box-containing protein
MGVRPGTGPASAVDPAHPRRSSESPPDAEHPTSAVPHLSPLVIAGRYQVHSLLKAGNGISTFLAEDLSDTTGPGTPRVVVKTTPLASLSKSAWLRLEHEAAVVATLSENHALVAAGRDEETAWLVQPFIAGSPLDTILARGPLPACDALAVASEILGTLERMHAERVVHRDIKPANVIVDDGTGVLRATLIDFGLARSNRLPAAIRDLPVGTAQFMAPEQAQAPDGDVDERADLYSLGVLLFTCLAGRPPFGGNDAGEVLRAHIAVPAPTLASVVRPSVVTPGGPAVPGAVEALVGRLLAKDPADRYQSAAAVRADVDDIAAALAAGEEDPPILIGLRDHRRTLTEPAFVGRAAELEVLDTQLDEIVAGRGGLVVVEAESGGGKTRLLDELARHAGQRCGWIIRGQGQDQTGQRPLQLLEGIARAILRSNAEDGGALAARLRRDVGEHAASIIAALPELAGVLTPPPSRTHPGTLVAVGGRHSAPSSPGPESYGEARSLVALPSLLAALGTPERPALVILDDCQWADALTARILSRWQASTDAASWVGIVVAYRSEEVGPHDALRGLTPSARLPLRPLDAGEVAGLVQSMAGPLPDAALMTVTRLSEGNPFMAAAVLRGMAECGALVGAHDAWVVDPIALRGVQASRRAASFLLRRMDLLSPAALTLLSVGAVLGKDFDLSQAVTLAGQDAARAVPALAEARARRIVWVDEDANRGVFFHDKLREALLDRQSPAERRSLHLRAAELIEGAVPQDIFELAYHFDAAGAAERALPYALGAGAQARRQYALEVAEAQYRIARRSAATGSDNERRQAAEGLGEVLSLRGSYAEAAEHLREARALAVTTMTRAQLDWRLGEVAFRCGNVNEALVELQGALGQLGRKVPRTRVLLVLALTLELLVQAAHSLVPPLFIGRRKRAMPEAESLAARIYSRLAYVNWFRSGRVPCAWAHLRGMNMAERFDPGPELAQAYSEHAPVMTMIPWYGRGTEYAARSLRIRTDLDDEWGQGQSLSFMGVVRYAASDFPAVIDSCERAGRLLDRTGDRWEANTASWHLALAHYRMGDLGRAATLAEETYRRATDIGDQASAGISLSVWSRATGGQVPGELVAGELAKHTDDAHTATELGIAEGVRLLHESDPSGAVAALQAAARVVAAAGLRQEYVAPVQPWLATALRTEAEGCGPFAGRRRRVLVHQARRAARRGRRIARHYRNNLPHALRELAQVEMMLGHTRAAHRCLDESLAVAGVQGAVHEHALSVAAGARMEAAPPWQHAGAPQAGQATGEAAPHSHPEDGEPAMLPVDRFAGLLDAGRTIAAAPSLPALREAVGDAALRILRGESCCFIEVTPGGEAGEIIVAGGGNAHPTPAISHSLVRQSVAAGHPLTDHIGASAQESLELAGIRSALCVPIVAEGRPVECLYVTHAHLGSLFGPEEVQLAAFIASLTGAALEHLAGTEARFRSLVEHASDVITIVDEAGTIQYQSSSLAGIFGYAAPGLLRTPVAAWMHPGDAAGMAPRLAQLTAGAPAVTSLECRLRHADGSWRPAELTFTNLLADPGVRGIVLNIRDLSELRWQETHDPLTGLANRSLFIERVGEVLERIAAEGRPGAARHPRAGAPAVLYADLDDFKAVNDLLGHRAGDAVLAAVGKRLRGAAGLSDTVARFGGDEFAVLLPDAAEGEAEALAAHLITTMRTPLTFANREVRVQASIGIAQGEPGQNVSDLLAQADLAMYEAKSEDRGSYRVFEPQMRSAAVERSTLKAELAGALEREELVLHYQPIVDLATTRMVGLQALPRWRHPGRGLLVPATFMALVEDSQQMFELGTWVLRESCIQAQALPSGWAAPGTGPVSVNVSGRQLEDRRFVHAVREALDTSGLDPWRLVLEITETAMVRDVDAILGRLGELKALGVRLAVGDVGTGHSSLRYLHELPVDFIKIDKAFVAGLGKSTEESSKENSEMQPLAETIINLGHSLGLIAVAEGVETLAQAEHLRGLGCELAQGCYYSHPVDLAGLVSLLRAA